MKKKIFIFLWGLFWILFAIIICLLTVTFLYSNCATTGSSQQTTPEPDPVWVYVDIRSAEDSTVSVLHDSFLVDDNRLYLETTIDCPQWNYIPCETTIVYQIIDTCCLDKKRYFNQIQNCTKYTTKWNKNSESDMDIYMVNIKEGPAASLTNYTIKTVKQPDTSCVINESDLPGFIQSHAKIDLYLIAQDSSNNKSEPTSAISVIFASEPGIQGDTDNNGKFDELDYNRMEALIWLGEYRPWWDYNADGKVDSLDLKEVVK